MAAALYNMALRQASSIQTDLTRLESEPPMSSSSVALQGQITASMAALSRTVEDYESTSKREMNEAKRDKAMARVKKFRDDEKTMRTTFNALKNRDPATFNPAGPSGTSQTATSGLATAAGPAGSHAPYASSSARAPAANLESPFSLHARNSAAGSSSHHNSSYPPHSQQQHQYASDPLAAYKMNASAEAMFGAPGPGGSYTARENHALREHSFIENTEAQLDAFIAQGREVWTNLTEQRDILKGTQRKLLDAANTMGLSRNVINMIERRSTQDNILFAVGVVFTLVCFFYIYKWFG